MPQNNKLLVIIITYNAMSWAERCFQCLRQSTLKPDIFVIDNGSTDGTQKYIKEHYPEIIFRQSKSNLGFGKANNIGMQYAIENNYDFIYLLNQDAWVNEDVFEKLIQIYNKNPNFGILSPLQMTGDGTEMDKNFLFNIKEKRCKGLLKDIQKGTVKQVYSANFIMAAHWFIPTKILNHIGLFSPIYKHYGEDGNLIDRMHYWGYNIGVCPYLKAFHDRKYRKNTPEQQLYLCYVSFLRGINNPNRVNIIRLIIRFLYHTLSIKNATIEQKTNNIKNGFSCIGQSNIYRKIYKQPNCYEKLNKMYMPF